MTYYILLEGEPRTNLMYDANILGELSYTTFYPNRGFSKLTKVIESYPELLDTIQIFDDSNKQYTVSKFLKILEKSKIAK